MPALVNDLAPDHLRGRYNAASSAAFQVPSVIAPPFAGFLIGHHLAGVYITSLVVGGLVLVWLALRLERGLPAHVNGLTMSADRARDSEPSWSD
ncbi:MAG: MFS transporter [Tetrasphaera sp.]